MKGEIKRMETTNMRLLRMTYNKYNEDTTEVGITQNNDDTYSKRNGYNS